MNKSVLLSHQPKLELLYITIKQKQKKNQALHLDNTYLDIHISDSTCKNFLQYVLTSM